MQDRIIKILNSNNIEEEISKLSFEEKIEIANSGLEAACILYDYLEKKGLKLFNREETIYFLENIIPSVEERDLLYNDVKRMLDYPYDSIIDYLADVPISLEIMKNPEVILNKEVVSKGTKNTPYYLVPDEILEKKIKTIHSSKEAYDIVIAFKSDEYKMKYLHKVSLDDKSFIICSLSDENKKKYLTPLMPGRTDIIVSLNDKDKEKYLHLFAPVLRDEERAEIICHFDDKEYVRRNIRYLITEKGKIDVIYWYSCIEELNDQVEKLALSLKREVNITECLQEFINRDVHHNIINTLIGKITNSKNICNLLQNTDVLSNSSLFTPLLSRLNQRQLKKILDEYSNYRCPYYILMYIKDNNYIIEYLKHSFIDEKYKDDMLPLFEIVAEKYNVNLKHLIELAKTLDSSVLGLIESDNVSKALNLDDDAFAKYLKIFTEKNLTLNRSSMSAVLNSFLNKKFSIDNPDKIQIFIDTIHAVADGNMELAINKINEVISKIDISKYNIEPKNLISGILNGNEDIIVLYNKMTYEYLNNVRNDYVNETTPNYLKEISSEQYEINELVKKIIQIYPKEMIMRVLKKTRLDEKDFLTKEENALLNNEEALKELIEFKKNPNYELSSEYKKLLKPFNNILKVHFYRNMLRIGHIEGIKKNYNPMEVNYNKIIEILPYIDVDKLQKFVFTNPKMEEELYKYLEKYGILSWTETCGYLATQADLEITSSCIGSLISNFTYIMNAKKEKEEKGERFTLVSEIALASCLDSDAEIYSYLLGKDNYKYIASNPGPNSSPKNREYRLNKALEDIYTMHERKYITVPPVDEDFKLKNGKSINICLGNTNDPINLTYGERTGACMRIGGAGSSLFNFCLENENGFHISFNHPQTGNLISRVSCFRNGNTLFMNQLRDSLDKEYSKEMIKESCELIAKRIIESTKDSKYPILNVVASDGYAFNDEETVASHCNCPNKGFSPTFYTDVSSYVVVVATSKPNKELSPIELGPNKTEKYEVGRAPIRKYEEEKASLAISHIEALDSYLSKVAIDEISIDKKNVSLAYVGEDWYVALTVDGNVINYVQNNSRNREIANAEMQKYTILLQDSLKYSNIVNENEKGQVL